MLFVLVHVCAYKIDKGEGLRVNEDKEEAGNDDSEENNDNG